MVLSKHTPNSTSSVRYIEFVKEELQRLIFIGDSAISQQVVIHLMLTRDIGLDESELDKIKVKLIKTSTL
jgi:hypothetical protein